MDIKKNLANIITFTRIIGTLVMLLTDVLSVPFYISYVYSGLSDVLDGFIARKLGIQSEFGKKLDSISDLFFYTTMMLKIWPYLVTYLPKFVWVIIWVTVAIRVLSYVYVFIKKGHLMSNHTIFNKLSGLLIFMLPFLIDTKHFVNYSIFVSLEALCASIYEIVYMFKNRGV